MPATQLRHPTATYLCGLGRWHPQWMQRFATMKMFMAVYGLLGTIQAMSYMYFIVTLTTIERRFKIPSQTTGIILSGNEISQILLSLILTYIGGRQNRPHWIAFGSAFCGLSCYILALPHVIYGAGEDALQLTKEYADELAEKYANSTNNNNVTLVKLSSLSQQLCGSLKLETECDTLITLLPLILIFLSQFVLGIGSTLYFSLGHTYLDDNTKKTNTPLMLAVAISLRMTGPIIGFFIGYVCLNMFIDPWKTPLIDSSDPRWLGAWWFGWIVLGTLMILFSGLVGLFPKELPRKNKPSKYSSHVPQVLRREELQMEEAGLPLGRSFSSTATLDTLPGGPTDLPTLKDFPKALMRLLRNKLLIFNSIAAIFYLLGATGLMTFLSRYMEVQLHRNAHSATIIVGPVSIGGMIIGLIGSGIYLTKKKPSPSKVLMWNVVVGGICMIGQMSYTTMYCKDSMSHLNHNQMNFSRTCNQNCYCDSVPYSPVCDVTTDTTYYSPCHAGCNIWDAEQKVFSNCSCLANTISTTEVPSSISTLSFLKKHITTEPTTTTTTGTESSTLSSILPKILKPLFSSTSTSLPSSFSPEMFSSAFEEVSTTKFTDFTQPSTEGIFTRSRRAISETIEGVLKPGGCLKDCDTAFYSFAITSMIVSWFGSSGRIGNILVNYRAVSTEDKSFAQGLSLMLISLFASIPGPIIFGWIIDSTCLVWTQTCKGRGNCQLYDQTSFRYLVNGMACVLTGIGVVFDALVWYYGRHLDLYGEKEAKHLEEARRKNKAISPLLAKTPNGE